MILKLEKDGVEIIPSVFTVQEIKQLKMASKRIITADNPNYKGKYKSQDAGDKPSVRWGASLADPVMADFSNDQRIQDIVSGILGNEIMTLNNQYVYREGGTQEEFDWHIDITPEDVIPNSSDYLQVIIVVDTWVADNGAVEYMLGSHTVKHGTAGEVSRFYRGKRGTKIFPNSGDVVIWRASTAHRSDRNTTNGSRGYLLNAFGVTTEGSPYLTAGKHQLIDGNLLK